MKNASVLLQLLMLIGGIVAVFIYVRPEFQVVRERQDMISRYGEAIKEVTELRSVISELENSKNNMSADSINAIETYLPHSGETDILSVKRDLLAYIERSDLSFKNVSYDETIDSVYGIEEVGVNEYSLNIAGGYNEIKNFIFYLESNNYPLRFNEVTLSTSVDDTGDGDEIVVSLLLENYYYSTNLQEFNF